MNKKLFISPSSLPKILGFALGLSPLWFAFNPSIVISLEPTVTIPTISISPTQPSVATSSQNVEEDLKQRIQNVVSEKLKSGQESLEQKISNRFFGFVGQVANLKQESFTLNQSTDSVQILFATNSAIVKDNKTIKSNQLSIGDRAIVIGQFGNNRILTAKRIVITPTSTTLSKKIIQGQVTKIDKVNKTLKIKVGEEETTYSTTKDFSTALDQLKINDKIIGIALTPENKTPTLLKIKVI